jgi:alpha-L-rhamnosidase
VLIPVLIPVAASGAASPAPSWPAHPDWQRFVMAPKSDDVTPTGVVRTSGGVSGATTLTRPGHVDLVLTMKAGGPQPTVVLDYGQDVGGIPYFVVRSQKGSPTLTASYSEGLAYIGPEGDGAPSGSGAGDTSRVDHFTIGRPGRVTNGLIQGGERYQQISLTTPGTVTLSSVGIRFTAVRATSGDYRGWFDSSSSALDRIWYDGAYTAQLDELPAGTVPGTWQVTHGALDNNGGFEGLLRNGDHWGDYTATFEARIVHDDAGWIVRSTSSLSGYLFFLSDSHDSAGPPDTLREFSLSPTSFTLIAEVHLRTPIAPGTWHRISTVADGPRLTTSLDGHVVATFSSRSLPAADATYASGSFGLVEYANQEAQFRHLDVTVPGGATLFSNDLALRSALTDFTGPNVESGQFRPAILDGAKRDREVWSGDLGVEGPNVFYTTDAADYIKDSLQLLGSYQSADGEAAGSMSPTAGVGTFPQSGDTYSSSYSMDEVVNLATYYLYTGDLAFIRAEWPMIARELAYTHTLLDSHGLLVTDSRNGKDWDYYDGAKSGEVTAYNDIYYETLTDAASMAAALGKPGQAASYRQQAASLRAAINRSLFDPLNDLYRTSNLQPGTVAQDANALAVTDHVASGGVVPLIVAQLQKALPSTPYGPLPFTANAGYRAAVSPFVTNDEVQAEFDAGDTNAALALIEQLWGYMDAPGPNYSGADWELVGADGTPGFGSFTSLAHGWSSGPTADLSADVLGVQPVRPGYRTWLIQPHPGSLAWVEGNVPTPKGTIAVRWAQVPADRSFTMSVIAPKGTSGTISVPVPTTGARLTVRASATGHVLRIITTAPGATYQAVPATGGRTYYLSVTPSTD